jgi:hypothetical protein
MLTALMGFTLRSFLLSRGIRTFLPESTHMPFDLRIISAPIDAETVLQASVSGL